MTAIAGPPDESHEEGGMLRKLLTMLQGTLSCLVVLCVIFVVFLAFFHSSAVRDIMLIFLVLAGIFYFEWVLSEMTKKLDAIQMSNSDELHKLRLRVEEIVDFVRAEEAKRDKEDDFEGLGS